MIEFVRSIELRSALEVRKKSAASILAGGTDLILMRGDTCEQTGSVLDIKGITELSGVKRDGGSTVIGACTTLDALGRLRIAGSNAVADGAVLVGSWQTRCRGTIGGNICRASPAADTLCGLLVLRAKFDIASCNRRRFVDASDFFKGPGCTVLQSDEILIRIILPDLRGRSSYVRFTYRRAMDLSVAGVALYVEMEGNTCIDARVAVGACGPTPLLIPSAAAALRGTTLNDDAVNDAAREIVGNVSPIDDVRGTRNHRLFVLPSVLKRNVSIVRRRYRDS